MGKKVNPVGFRIGINKNYKSLWFAEGDLYKKQLQEDLNVRKFLKKTLKSAGIGEITIKRSLNNVIVDISVARPGVVIGKGGQGLEELKKTLDVMFGSGVHLDVHDIKKPELSAMIVSQNIVDGVLKRMSAKFLMERELVKIKEAGALGAKIQVSGRVNGSEIHRTDKVKFGSVPLQTIRADIDYSDNYAKTKSFGILGVKVWIYKGEKNYIDEDNGS